MGALAQASMVKCRRCVAPTHMYSTKLQTSRCLQNTAAQKTKEGGCFLQQKLREMSGKKLRSVHQSAHSPPKNHPATLLFSDQSIAGNSKKFCKKLPEAHTTSTSRIYISLRGLKQDLLSFILFYFWVGG
jgi:hypothetical protein